MVYDLLEGSSHFDLRLVSEAGTAAIFKDNRLVSGNISKGSPRLDYIRT